MSEQPTKNLNEIPSQGIPSVSNSNTAKSKPRMKLLYLIVFVLLLGFIALWLYFKSRQDIQTEPSPDENSVGLTSNRQLAPVDISSESTNIKAGSPDFKTKPDEPNEPEPKPAPSLPEPPAPTPMLSLEAQNIPTLEELKFAAPMMGQLTSSPNAGRSGLRGNDNMSQTPSMSDPNYSAFDLNSASSGLNGSQTLNNTGQSLASMLQPVSTPPSTAQIISKPSLKLSKGTVIECVLETKVDTTVPGMTSCVVPRDIYSMNGRLLLIERGSKVIGEYQGAVQNGLARIFMLWTEIRTPLGVSVQLNSPTADPLGGTGMGGYVDFHWWKRFGNALLFSIVSDGFQYIVNTANTNNNNGDVTYANTENGMNEIIKKAMAQSGNIPPTLIKNQGERVSIFVARDVDFSNVYGIKANARQ